jgi:NADH:ubiquinone oxidoreductase subunit 4 (subunit M)
LLIKVTQLAIHPQMDQPTYSFALQADGLSIAMLLLTLALTLSLYFLRLRIIQIKRFMRNLILWLLP